MLKYTWKIIDSERKFNEMNKKLIAKAVSLLLIFTVVLLPCLLVGSGASSEVKLPFKDVRENQWFYAAVSKMYSTGLMQGKSDVKFDPKATMTRAELVTLMARIARADTAGLGKYADRFGDVGAKAWHRDYVGWAAKNGLAQGYDGNLFKPNAPIKRLELATFIIRLVDFLDLKLPEAPLVDSFEDAVTFPSWAKENIERMRLLGLIEGKVDGKFIAYNSVTRAEVATIVSRFCDYLSIDPMHDAVKRISAEMENSGGRAIIRLGDASTVTAENLSLIIMNSGTGLDIDTYSICLNDNEINAIASGDYKDAAVGDNVDTVISLYIKNKVTGEVTETIKLNVRLKRVSDFESEMIPEFKYKIKLDGTAEITDYVGVRYVTNLTVPASFGGVKVTSIGKEAFKESRELVSVRIPEGITFIDTSAFALCTSLKEVYLPESVTKVGRAAFYYCNSLEAVTLPSGLVRIPDYMFYMCTALESVTHSKSLEEIGKYAFSNCILTDFGFNEGLQIVGEYAFEGCAFTKVYLPDSCTYAGHWAFYNCLWLAEASFGDNLEIIGSGILYNTSVKELHFRGSAEQFKKIYQLSAFDDEFPIIFEK